MPRNRYSVPAVLGKKSSEGEARIERLSHDT